MRLSSFEINNNTIFREKQHFCIFYLTGFLGCSIYMTAMTADTGYRPEGVEQR
jgi:hypothetical protein